MVSGFCHDLLRNTSHEFLLLRHGIDEVGRSICPYAIAFMNVAEGVQDWLLLQNCLEESPATVEKTKHFQRARRCSHLQKRLTSSKGRSPILPGPALRVSRTSTFRRLQPCRSCSLLRSQMP